MKRMIFTLVASALSLCTYADSPGYAIEVVDWYNPSSGSYYFPEDALGPPNGAPDDSSGVYSLGVHGWIVLRLGRPVVNIAGPDLVAWEESAYFDHPATRLQAAPDEDANIYLSNDGLSWVLVGKPRTGVSGSMAIDIEGKGVEGSTLVKVLDISGRSYPNHDGYDLDAVTLLSVPEPSTTSVKLTGALALAFLVRRKSKGAG